MIQLTVRLLVRYNRLNWALADQTMVSGVNFLTGILLARYLGLEEFGRFTLAWMAVLFVSSIQHAAINSPMMSIGPKQVERETPAYYGAVLAQQVAFAALSFAFLLVGAGLAGRLFPEWSVGPLMLPLAGAAFAYLMQDFLRRYFFTRDRPAAAFVNDAVSYLGQLALLIVLFQIVAMDSARALWVIAATSALAVLVGAFGFGRVVWNAAVLPTVVLRHWRSAKWLSASALMEWTTGNLFIMAAGALLGASAVGALKAAQTLIGVTHILFLGLGNIVPVQAARRFAEGGAKALTAYLGRVTLGGEFATAVVAVVLAAAPGFWLTLVFGQEYGGYGYLLQWFAVIYLVRFLALPLRAGLRAIEFTQPLFYAYLAGTLFALAGIYPLIHWLGLAGVMAGLLTIRVIQTVILASGFNSRLKDWQPAGTDNELPVPKTDCVAVDRNS